MWIVAAGMPRSGSTLQYQILKSLLINEDVFDLGWVDYQNHEFLRGQYLAEDTVLIKSHELTPLLQEQASNNNLRIIYSSRNILDVISSHKQKNNITFNLDELGILVERFKQRHLNWIRQDCILHQNFSDFLHNLSWCILQIADFLHLNYSETQSNFLANELSLDSQTNKIKDMCNANKLMTSDPYNIYDPVTLLHTNHIDRPFGQRHKYNLNQEEIDCIKSHWLGGLSLG